MRGMDFAHTHGGSETTIDLEDGEFVEAGGIGGREFRVGDNLVFRRRRDAFPVTVGE